MAKRGGRLSGRGCLIVGGTGGIGLAAARRFLEEGARVVVCGKTEAERDEARRLLGAIGPVEAVAADATRPEAVAALFDEAITFLGGRLDVMFHVAGISGRRLGDGPLHDCTVEGWDAVLEANARSTFLTNREAVRRMRGQGLDEAGLRGTVLNTGTVLDEAPAPDFFGTVAYAASKGAVRALTLAAASRYARECIRFNLLAPGLIALSPSPRPAQGAAGAKTRTSGCIV